MSHQGTIYGVRLHDAENATVMFSMNGYGGPWIDMVTGHPEWCWEIVEALAQWEQSRAERQ